MNHSTVFSNLDLLSFSTTKIVTSSGRIVLSPQYHASERICILRLNLFFEESAAKFSMNSRTLPLPGFDAPNFHGGYLIDMWAFLIDPKNMSHLFLLVQPLTDKVPTMAPIHMIHKVYFLRNQQLFFLLQ